jgi:hypothetical protein
MTGFGVLLSGLYGAAAGVSAFLIARAVASPKRHRRLHYAVLGILMLAALTARPAVVEPLQRTHEINGLLNDNPLFKLVLADNPALKEPVRNALSKAAEDGSMAEAFKAGYNLLSPVLPKYLSRASDASVLEFTNGFTSFLRNVAAEDPNRCYQYLFPNAAGTPSPNAKENTDALMTAALHVVESAHEKPVTPDVNAGKILIQAEQARLIERFGNDLTLLQHPDAQNVDRAKVVTMVLGLYSDILALPPADAATALRSMFAQ